jgi:WD40 repeat protein
VTALAFSPNRPQIAVAYNQFKYGPVQGVPIHWNELKLWDVEAAKEILPLSGMEGVKDFSAQLQWLADGETAVLRFGVVPKVWRERHTDPPRAVPEMDGPRRATALEVWDTGKPARKQAFILPVGGPEGSATRRSVLSADGSRLFVHVTDSDPRAKPPTRANRVVVWDVGARRPSATLRLPDEAPGPWDRANASRVKRDGRQGVLTVYAGGHGGPSLSKLNKVGDSGESYQDVARDVCLALSPNGRVLVVGDREGVIRVYDVASGEAGPKPVP